MLHIITLKGSYSLQLYHSITVFVICSSTAVTVLAGGGVMRLIDLLMTFR